MIMMKRIFTLVVISCVSMLLYFAFSDKRANDKSIVTTATSLYTQGDQKKMNENQSKNKEANELEKPSHEYFYEMPPDKVKAFRGAILQIKIGDSRQKVIDLLGKPTIDGIMSPKEPWRWREPKRRLVRYYVKIYEKGFSNVKFDRHVTFIFDNDDRLKEIYSNVDTIDSKK